jgi:large subunit ribosomal protein L25
MESITLRAEARSRSTKGSVHGLRRQGLIPGVVYGKEVDNLLVQLSEKDLSILLERHSIGGTLINLELSGGQPMLVMIREVQRDPVKQTPLHADFLHVSLNQTLETEIPVHLEGEPAGVKQGGILGHMLREVTVSCLPSALPEHLAADISNLEIGGQLTVGDLQLPAGVTAVTAPETIIAVVAAPAAEIVEEEEEAEGEEAEAAPESEE